MSRQDALTQQIYRLTKKKKTTGGTWFGSDGWQRRGTGSETTARWQLSSSFIILRQQQKKAKKRHQTSRTQRPAGPVRLHAGHDRPLGFVGGVGTLTQTNSDTWKQNKTNIRRAEVLHDCILTDSITTTTHSRIATLLICSAVTIAFLQEAPPLTLPAPSRFSPPPSWRQGGKGQWIGTSAPFKDKICSLKLPSKPRLLLLTEHHIHACMHRQMHTQLSRTRARQCKVHTSCKDKTKENTQIHVAGTLLYKLIASLHCCWAVFNKLIFFF